MAVDLVNASDADVNAWGGASITAVARAITASAAPTDAQAIAGLTAGSGDMAVLKAAATAQNKARVAGVLLDSILADLNLSTAAQREAFKLKKGLDELEQIADQLGL